MRETPSPEQRTDWRRRMVEAIISRAFDDETFPGSRPHEGQPPVMRLTAGCLSITGE
jgi:hypothetical protein